MWFIWINIFGHTQAHACMHIHTDKDVVTKYHTCKIQYIDLRAGLFCTVQWNKKQIAVRSQMLAGGSSYRLLPTLSHYPYNILEREMNIKNSVGAGGMWIVPELEQQTQNQSPSNCPGKCKRILWTMVCFEVSQPKTSLAEEHLTWKMHGKSRHVGCNRPEAKTPPPTLAITILCQSR